MASKKDIGYIILVAMTKCSIKSDLKGILFWALGLSEMYPVIAGKKWRWERLLLQPQERLEACSHLSTNQVVGGLRAEPALACNP